MNRQSETMKNFVPNNEDRKKSWTPRIITLVITFLAILFFYPHIDEDSLFRFKEGQLWDHGDLVTQDSLVVPPDSATRRMVEDSLRSHFVYVYTPVGQSELNTRAIIDSVDSYVMQSLPSNIGVFERLFSSSPKVVLRENLRHNLQKYYRGKVISVPEGTEKPEKIMLSQNSRSFTDEITTVDEIVESILHSVETQDFSTEGIDTHELEKFIIPNVVLNREASEERLNAELGLEIDALTQAYAPGYRIVSRGDLVTPQQGRLITLYTQQLLATGSVEHGSSALSVLGQAVYILLLLGFLIGYMNFYAPKVWQDNRNFIFIVSLVGLFVVITALVSRYMVLGLYLIPIVMVPILVQVFFHGRMALWTGFVTVLLCAGMTTSAFQFLVIEFVGMTAAVFSLRDLTKRSQLLQTSIFVGVGYIVMYVAYQLILNGSFDNVMGRMITVLAVNAVLTSVCYVLMFPIERIFGFISNVTLIELTDVNTPLLRSLSDECPGTFNHVIAVSNLADDAARRIGANALLTRAGAMYHDIGKLANPAFFTENQHGINPHDGLSPQQSAEIIIGHVTEGLKRAEKAGLPKVLRNFISEHHGAGKAKYFYFTACQQNPGRDVDPAAFTYPGPNPRSRETAVVMMADAVEAASRSLKEHTPQAITDLVNKIIDGQIADGLFNDSPLSFHDVQLVKEVFIRRLMTMYHSRIAYPDDPNKKKAAENGAPDTKPTT